MAQVTAVNEYQKIAGNLPDEVFLGQLVFFTISEADVDLESIRNELVLRNLRTDTLRKRLRPIDAFKKAANEVAVKFSKSTSSQHSILVRPVGQDAESSHRHIVLERALFQTGKKRQLNYEILAMAIYDRGVRQKDGTIVDDQISVTINNALGGYTLQPEEQAWVDGHIGTDGERIIERYHHWCVHMDSHAVRSFVREYIDLLGGIQVKTNGGVYFVPQKHAEELKDLASFVQSINSDMHLIPLLDIVDQRTMLAKAFEQEAIAEVDSLTVELSKILNVESRTVTQATYDEYVEKASNLVTKATEYTGLLGEDLDIARIKIDMFKTQVLALNSRIKVSKRLQKAAM